MRCRNQSGVEKVLSFAAVGPHGREWWMHTAARVFALVLAASSASAQTASPRDLSPGPDDPVPILTARTLIATRRAILDVAPAGDSLIVLGRDTVSLYPRADASGNAGAPVASAPIAHTRVWPRDLRGLLRTTPRGFDVFLPGVTCRATTTPFAASCADQSEPWPIGIENAGVVANHNAFLTPEGLAFFGAARVGRGAAARWVVADTQGTLAFLNTTRGIEARGPVADDVVAVDDACGSGAAYAITVAQSTRDEGVDELQLLHVAGTTAATASRLAVPGRVTALWAPEGRREATAIVRHEDGLVYEALLISLACAR